MPGRPDGALGGWLPRLVTSVPGPRSRALAERLAQVESRNVTSLRPSPPIFWEAARGANVRDADDNVYIDLTAGFGVAMAGHANPGVAAAVGAQAALLAHGLGDVHPAGVRVQLLERLAGITPGDLGVTILGSSGAEAVEAALKTAALATGRHGIVAFEGAYHGLTYGALAVTDGAHFRAPFAPQLNPHVQRLPFPRREADTDAVIAALDDAVHGVGRGSGRGRMSEPAARVGAVIVEPVQGRGGLVVPAPDFLPRLRARCDAHGLTLIFDEVYTGCGRTGRWFACQHWGAVPDVLVLGKALTGSLPLSAAVGTPGVMAGWPASAGEAIHTSTFLGNPIACAAALAQLDAIERGRLVERAAVLGARIRTRVDEWVAGGGSVVEARGIGLLQGARLADAAHAARVVRRALEHGVLVLAEGAGDVLALTPPATITDAQLDHALEAIDDAIRHT